MVYFSFLSLSAGTVLWRGALISRLFEDCWEPLSEQETAAWYSNRNHGRRNFHGIRACLLVFFWNFGIPAQFVNKRSLYCALCILTSFQYICTKQLTVLVASLLQSSVTCDVCDTGERLGDVNISLSSFLCDYISNFFCTKLSAQRTFFSANDIFLCPGLVLDQTKQCVTLGQRLTTRGQLQVAVAAVGCRLKFLCCVPLLDELHLCLGVLQLFLWKSLFW